MQRTGSGPNRYYELNLNWDSRELRVEKSKKLKAIAERIVAAGEPLSEYIDVEFSVSEKRFTAWPTNMKEQFLDARTVKGGKPSIKVEFNGVEVQ